MAATLPDPELAREVARRRTFANLARRDFGENG